MDGKNLYRLPMLHFGYKDLEPYISEEQLTIHHQKHHQAYVDAANSILEKIDNARKSGTDYDIKSALKELSFNIGGHVLHSLFWGNLAPAGGNINKPRGAIWEAIESEFGSLEQFEREFSQAAKSVEGSGWAALSYDRQLQRPVIMQIEKHNANVHPGFAILMVLDVFEHAYYLDYKNARAKYVDAFWNIANWEEANIRLKEATR